MLFTDERRVNKEADYAKKHNKATTFAAVNLDKSLWQTCADNKPLVEFNICMSHNKLFLLIQKKYSEDWLTNTSTMSRKGVSKMH